MLTITASTATRASLVLVCVAAGISAVEALVRIEYLSPSALYDWHLIRARRPWTDSGVVAEILERLFAPGWFPAVPAAQLVVSAALASGITPRATAPGLAIVLGCQLLTRLRLQRGFDGADQMITVVLAGLLAYHVAPPGYARTLALDFIAAQSFLSYVVAGFAKLISKTWRDGSAAPAILATREYGSRRLFTAVSERAVWAKAFTRATIAFELLGPFLILFGPKGCLVFIVLGTLMHGWIAATMGLNTFFWSFVAAYPVLVLVSRRLP